MTEWYTPTGSAQTTSNVAPDNVRFGAKIQTSTI